MEKPLNKNKVINIGFYIGLGIKAINALMEFTGGFLMLTRSHEQLNRLIHLIALPELRKDPNDVVMNYFIVIVQNLSISSQHAVAIYLLLHGAIKLAVIGLLWKKIMWSYPLAMFVFGLFVAYETYSYLNTQSVLLLLTIIIDVAIIMMIVLEYRHLKSEKVNIG
ncbi:Hypothetical protein Tpal_760 [Trichococcus palustris]|uniref:DUF2127 domain-containing protein n=1 Tax=Trichococcus palustris TaxID=140314 RepID=A0A143YAZ7_9LACT|nr:DUF2127 domain-containing protein [Trichococcus palustris]CZQ86346.1 Hypothetical protein Tpal_760 [Trichococcus palustris]SFK58469.1 Uncharacterized membrane protein [Trichococcus palustris]